MDDRTNQALHRSQIVDITTTGRQTRTARRIEIALHEIDGRLFISGMPTPGRTRAWIHNLAADAHLTVHLKQGATADLTATARVITDPDERRRIMTWIVANAWPKQDVEAMTSHSPLIEIEADEAA